MKHLASARFWALCAALPAEVRAAADKNYAFLRDNPQHPSLHFKWLVRYGPREWETSIGYAAKVLTAACSGINDLDDAATIVVSALLIVAWRCGLQKFGLDSLKSEKLSALELEIAKEKSTALGIAGKRIRDSIVEYTHLEYTHSILNAAVSSDERARLLASVSANVQALIVQRELVGFTHDNMKWIAQTYDVPEEVLAKLGEVLPRNPMSP